MHVIWQASVMQSFNSQTGQVLDSKSCRMIAAMSAKLSKVFVLPGYSHTCIVSPAAVESFCAGSCNCSQPHQSKFRWCLPAAAAGLS